MKLRSTLRIGRGAHCEVRIDHDTVSREHATLQLRGDGRLRLRDLDSSNGTFRSVGGSWRRITEGELERGEQVRFGEVETSVEALLEQLPELALALGVDLDEAELEERPAQPHHERPRRNPSTGDIEESS